MQRFIRYLIAIILLLCIQTVRAADTVDPSSWVATDGLGRTMPTSVSKSTDHYRAVGIFYWTWHLGQNANGPYNVNNISKANPDKNHDYEWWSQNYKAGAYWWNEPIYGYYKEDDDYVLRKQAELLADAGIDFVAFDCTNGTKTWESAYENLLKVWKEAQKQGVKVPKIVFMLPFFSPENTSIQFMSIYNNLYSPSSSNYKKYSSLFFNYNGKPLILMRTGDVTSEVKALLSKFEIRNVFTGYFSTGPQLNGSWGWLSAYPQAYYKKANGSPEQISVGVAQNASYTTKKLSAMNGANIMGRSYADGNYFYSYEYKNSTITVGSTISGSTAKSTNTSFYGRNFQQQWDYAMGIDPEIVFVTGWNEWIMGRFENFEGVKNAFPDEFNDEYSRDIEPSKGDLKDYYYYQLVSNVRKFKGVSSQQKQSKAVTINSTSDWNNSNILSYNHYTGGLSRNIVGFGKNNGVKYTNNSFRNDIKKAKVSYDASYIYFYVETVNDLNGYNSDKWMRLLIDTKSNNDDNWEEFEYIVNRVSGTSSTLVLEKSKGGWKFSTVGNVQYKVTKNILEIKIPRDLLGLTSSNIKFNFKWSDNNIGKGDIMTLYTDGDAAPGGRFAFHFEGKASYTKAQEVVLEKGDVNGDGKINTTDYILIRKYLLSLTSLDDKQKERADVNSDNKISVQDYIAIRKKLLNI